MLPLLNVFLQNPAPTAAPDVNVLVFLLVIFILLLLTFIVSGAEVAFFSLNYKDLNVLKTRQNNAGRMITRLLEKPKSLLASSRSPTSFSTSPSSSSPITLSTR